MTAEQEFAERVRALDAADPLSAFRDRFLAPVDDSVIAYLDGNSLGRPPASILERFEEFGRQQWGTRLIRGWEEGWLHLPERLGDRLGEVALGAAPGQVIFADSTTVCLYKVLHAAVAARPGRTEIVTDVDNFPTDRYVVEAVAARTGRTPRWLETDPAAGVTVEDLDAMIGPDTAVVVLSHVAYRSAYVADLAAITRLAHSQGALVVWDLCHSVGVLPVRLDEAGVDFAVGCTYKFLCGGPGSPAFLYVAAAHQDSARQPIWGWMGRRDSFAMEQGYESASGIRGMLSGTPPVLALLGVQEGVELVAEAGIEAIRTKSTALTSVTIEVADAWLAPLGLTVASPREDARRGGHVTVNRADAAELSHRLTEAGVLVDYRPPAGIRLGLSPLTTSFAELGKALRIIRDVAFRHQTRA